MAKVHGLVAFYADGKIATDAYQSVLLFKTKEDAQNMLGSDIKVMRVVTARVEKRKTKDPNKELYLGDSND